MPGYVLGSRREDLAIVQAAKTKQNFLLGHTSWCGCVVVWKKVDGLLVSWSSAKHTLAGLDLEEDEM